MTTDIGTGARLSPFQSEVWRSNGGRGLGVRHVVLLEGAPGADAIVAALEQVLARHPVLRTRFQIDAGAAIPRPVIESGAGLAIEQTDLRVLSPEARHAELSRLAPLDTLHGEGDLLRIGLARLSDARQALVLTASALAADAVTLDLIVDETMRVLGSAQPPMAPSDPLPFAVVAEWQNELQTAQEEAPGRAYWSAHADPRPRGRWPFPIRSTDAAEPRWTGASIAVDAAAADRLSACAVAAAVPIDIVVEAIWRVLLFRLTGQADVPIGVLVDGRHNAEMHGLVGPVSRVLPMTVRVEAAHDLYAVAQAVARVRDEALEWQDAYPGSAMPCEIGFASLPSRIPAPGEAVRVRLVTQTIALLPIPVQLVCRLDAAHPSLTLQYDVTRVPAAAMRTLAEQYLTLLTHAVAAPTTAVQRLSLVGAAERARQLTTFQRALERSDRVPPPAEDLVHLRIAACARTHPARLAVVAEDGTLTYAALDHRANELARHLRSIGVRADVPVGLAFDRGLQAVVGMLAILKAGGAFVPLEIRQPRERLLRMLADARITIVLTTSAGAPQLPASPALQIVAVDSDSQAISSDAPTPLASDVAPGNLAYVMFTSGSTGWPKGVAVEHRQLAQYVRAVTERLDLRPSWQYATVSTLAADLGHTMIFGALCSGGTLHIVGADLAADADRLASYLHEARVDCVKIVPSHLQALLTASRPEWVVPAQRLVLGGEASRWSLVRRVTQLSPGCAVYNHYGPTETTVGVVATRLDPEAALAEGEAEADGPAPLGHVLGGVQAFVVDEAGDLAAIGAVGELYLGGATVTRGYVHRPGQTAERFVPDGLSGRTGARLYRTGDLARFRPDGTLEYLGRRDRQVKFRGFRVELDEIRQALQRHPLVRDGFVVVAPDRTGADALVAYYVSRQPIDPGELRGCVAETIPEQTRPARYIHLTKLPLTPNGKIDVGALPSSDDAPFDAAAGVAPRTATEQRLAVIWQEILHLERVSVRDDFFELGGQSLIATVVIARIRKAFAVDLPFRALFEHRTIEGLAARVDRLQRARQTDLGEMASLVEQLKQLPADEVERLLADATSIDAKAP